MFFVRTLRQAAGLVDGGAGGRIGRPFAPFGCRSGATCRGGRPIAGDPRRAGRLAGRHRCRVRHRGDRDRDVVAAGRPRHRHARLGEFRRRLGRGRPAAQAARPPRAARPLRQTARSQRGRLGARCGVPVERHDFGGAGAAWRLDCRRSPRPGDLRRDFGGVRDAAALGSARCRHLVVAEGAGRRGGARHAGAVAAGRRAARELHPVLAVAKAVPADGEGQIDRGGVPRRDDQYAVDAVRRGRARTR